MTIQLKSPPIISKLKMNRNWPGRFQIHLLAFVFCFKSIVAKNDLSLSQIENGNGVKFEKERGVFLVRYFMAKSVSHSRPKQKNLLL
jgi:hypothetical protein